MLPGFIIEELRKREQRRQQQPQPQIQLPMEPGKPDREAVVEGEDEQRGVTVIPLFD